MTYLISFNQTFLKKGSFREKLSRWYWVKTWCCYIFIDFIKPMIKRTTFKKFTTNVNSKVFASKNVPKLMPAW